MFEDFGKYFQNLAADLVNRLPSQTCTESGPFNYIMFDQSGGKGRIFLHPTPLLAHDFPTGSASSPLPGSLQQECEDALLPRTSSSECDPRISARGKAVATLEENQNTSSDRNRNHMNVSGSFLEEDYSAFRAASEGESSQAAGGGGYSYEEDADDLAAFLGCTDDEEGSITTGNALSSELTYHFGLVVHENAGPLEPPSGKRGYEVEEEVDSKFYKRQRSQEELNDEVDDICDGTCALEDDVCCEGTCSSSVSVVDAFSGDSLGPASCPQEEDDNEEDCQELDESALELQMLCDDFGFEMPEEEQQCSSCTKEEDGDEEGDTISSGSARKSRREKIKKTVKLLRNIIPGGNCMDTAIVLDEAIHYVKLLQLQVQTLEAKRLVERVR